MQLTIFCCNLAMLASIYVLRFSVFANASHHLQARLKTWHVLREEDIIFEPHKRSIDEMGAFENGRFNNFDKQLSFNSFGRSFELLLSPTVGLFSEEFECLVHDHNGYKSVLFDKYSVMSGYVNGERHSHVAAQINGKILTATIKTENETYIVEPMWRHNDSITNIHKEMLVYRMSDVNLTHLNNLHINSMFCNSQHLVNLSRFMEESTETSELHQHIPKHLAKRSHRIFDHELKTICEISLVADYRFTKNIGNGNVDEAMQYMVGVIARVNKIFKPTNWDETGGTYSSGYGFRIKEIIVHTDPTESPRYNQDRSWDETTLLAAFDESPHPYCLAQLFTYQDFANGLLGLAYIGAEDLGGICSDAVSDGELLHYYNCGFVSTTSWGRPVLMMEVDLVSAHELGHSFGAFHDNDALGSECAPGSAKGGNYIMYPAAVLGYFTNNFYFSPCSKYTIHHLLKLKSHRCFMVELDAVCGNYVVEEGEECDSGRSAAAALDPCCGFDCKFAPGAVCSKLTSPCCDHRCQVANTTQICRAHVPGLCSRDTYCDGINSDCPAVGPAVADGSKCGDMGRCRNGTCLAFCQQRDLYPCLCTEPEYRCVRCCAKSGSSSFLSSQCMPFRENRTALQPLADNSTCAYGYCNQGVCEMAVPDVIDRVRNIIKSVTSNQLLQLLADNLAGSVCVLSLIVWIPLSCLINIVDKRRIRKRCIGYENSKDLFALFAESNDLDDDDLDDDDIDDDGGSFGSRPRSASFHKMWSVAPAR